MVELLTVDPALRSPGVALFRDGVLIGAARVKIPGAVHKWELGPRVSRVIEGILSTAEELGANPDAIAIETPKVYPRGKKRGGGRVDPNDLIGIALVAGGAAGAIRALTLRDGRELDVRMYLPAEWIGGDLPKSKTGDPWLSPRGQRLEAKLSAAERLLVPAQHDAMDAVGIGLYFLGRWTPKRVFPGAGPRRQR